MARRSLPGNDLFWSFNFGAVLGARGGAGWVWGITVAIADSDASELVCVYHPAVVSEGCLEMVVMASDTASSKGTFIVDAALEASVLA